MMLVIILKLLAAIIAGYLIGSIPFGVLVGRRFAKVDVRNYGSGKMGATNVLRVAGKKAAALVFILDLLKGVVAVFLAWFIVRGEYRTDVGPLVHFMLEATPALAALAAIAGHVWPLFLGFKGGRGVATFYGGMFALCPPVAIFSSQVFILGASTTRYVSLASVASAVGAYAIMVPLAVIDGFPWGVLLYGTIGSIAIIATHRDNIQRLLSGKERKLGETVEIVSQGPLTAAQEKERRRMAVTRELASLKWLRQDLHQ